MINLFLDDYTGFLDSEIQRMLSETHRRLSGNRHGNGLGDGFSGGFGTGSDLEGSGTGHSKVFYAYGGAGISAIDYGDGFGHGLGFADNIEYFKIRDRND